MVTRHNSIRRKKKARRGAAVLDFALVVGIILPMAAFVLWVAPRIILRVYEMISVIVSWPFM